MGKRPRKKKRSGIQVPSGAVYALLAAISLICITIVAVALADTDDGGPEKEEEKAPDVKMPHLSIEDVFFGSYEGQGMTVRISVYISNDGKETAKDVEAHIWPVVEDSNIATERKELDFGEILSNQTVMKEVVIGLRPDTLHSVELLVMESGKMVLKGRATVSTEGSGGGTYQDIEVRGTSGDSDYDGIPDDWERYYGLDPTNPSDAEWDQDNDGVSNLNEYRLNRDPDVGADDDDDTGCGTVNEESSDGGWSKAKEDLGEDSALAVGAVLFTLLIIGIIVVLIIAAAVSSNEHRKRKEKDREREEYESLYGPDTDRRSPSGGGGYMVRSGDGRTYRHDVVDGHREGENGGSDRADDLIIEDDPPSEGANMDGSHREREE